MAHRLRIDRKQARQKQALERQEYWTQLGPKKQLAELDRRLGTNVGAKKQRSRIAAQLKG